MKNYDMELQVIREKLLSLRSETTKSETTKSGIVMSPWEKPKIDHSSTEKFKGQPPLRHSRLGNVDTRTSAIAIKALKQRSKSQGHETFRTPPFRNPLDRTTSRATSTSTCDRSVLNSSADNNTYDLINKELPQLALLLDSINARSQQQASELLTLHRFAQQAAFSLRRRGIYAHPQLDIIDHFLEQSLIASLPKIEVNTQGELCLFQTTVNLKQAEIEAIDNAAILRQQTSPTELFSQPIATNSTPHNGLELSPSADTRPHKSELNQSGTLKTNNYEHPQKQDSQRVLNKTRQTTKLYKRLLTRLRQTIRRQRTTNTAHSSMTKPQFVLKSTDISSRGSFSWLDATIWSVSAAIIRVVLNILILNYPSIQTPLLLVLVSIISYSIYRVVLSQSLEMSATYRTGAALLGLFLGSVL